MSYQHGPQPQRCTLFIQHRRHAKKAHTQANRPRQEATTGQCQTGLFRQRCSLRA